MDVHLVWLTPDQLLEDEPYVNSLGGSALIQGVVIPEDPAPFRSKYRQPDPPAPRYRWDSYRMRLEHSRENVKVALVAIARARGEEDPPWTPGIRYPYHIAVNRRSLGYPDARTHLVRAMHAALEAAISGAGGIPKMDALATEYIRVLRELVPREDLDTRISMRDYAWGETPEGMSDREFAEQALEDTEKIRKLAMRLRRRTEGESRKAGTESRPPDPRKRRLHNAGIIDPGRHNPKMRGETHVHPPAHPHRVLHAGRDQPHPRPGGPGRPAGDEGPGHHGPRGPLRGRGLLLRVQGAGHQAHHRLRDLRGP